MEGKINNKIERYVSEMKRELKMMIQSTLTNESEKNIMINYINGIPNLVLTSEDLTKRRRIKNIVPFHERCMAKRANGVQCTRRRKADCSFCGTHVKNQPHGIVELNEDHTKSEYKQVIIRTQDINGILYYIDDDGNVYHGKDIMNNSENPRIIAKYVHHKETGSFHIPEFGI